MALRPGFIYVVVMINIKLVNPKVALLNYASPIENIRQNYCLDRMMPKISSYGMVIESLIKFILVQWLLNIVRANVRQLQVTNFAP